MDTNETRIQIPVEDINNDGRNQKDKPGEVRELPAGTIVKIAGMPLKAIYPITLETSSGAWKAIEEWNNPEAQAPIIQSTLPPSNGE